MLCLKKYVQLYLKQMSMCSLLKDSEKMSGRLTMSYFYRFSIISFEILQQMLDEVHAKYCNFANERFYIIFQKNTKDRIVSLG